MTKDDKERYTKRKFGGNGCGVEKCESYSQ